MSTCTLLALDSSTESLCLAACAQGRECVWQGPGGAQASTVLLDQARSLLRSVGADWPQLDAVAFAQGPGAFTGLRTACSVAQGLAFGLGRGVLAIDSLMIVADAAAQQAPRSEGVEVAVVMDARMGELYAGVYGATDSGWQVLEAPFLTTADSLAARWRDKPLQLLAGTGVASLLDAGPGTQPLSVAAPVSDQARAQALLRLAQQAWQAGQVKPAHEAVPFYVRDKVAQTVAERSALAKGPKSVGSSGQGTA